MLGAACVEEPDHLGPTTTTTLFPSQSSFQHELSGDGYQTAIVFAKQEREGTVLNVWIGVEIDKATRATDDAIFDHAVTLAKKYEATRSTEGRLRVELFELRGAGSVKDHIYKTRDFDLAATAGSTVAQTSTTPGMPVNAGPSTSFFRGLSGPGYVAYKMYPVQEGEIAVVIVGVRVAPGASRATYDQIYDQAVSLARQYQIAAGEDERLRVVLVEANSEQKELESRDFTLVQGGG